MRDRFNSIKRNWLTVTQEWVQEIINILNIHYKKFTWVHVSKKDKSTDSTQ